ncbi:hypothetical protein RJ639_011450 [Escallonia herrerae]|uniref:Uncharacterized protein n=1 Tax=Escallonia herrerae TaxID=1293975 RepID=A0AA88VS25_9ASTE|nr:hypothetical protein RJ639_011450 [Escallonia herrerae]
MSVALQTLLASALILLEKVLLILLAELVLKCTSKSNIKLHISMEDCIWKTRYGRDAFPLEQFHWSIRWSLFKVGHLCALHTFSSHEDNRKWFQPECTGVGSDGQVGPSPRAFHIAIAIDSHMFIFGGRSGSKRLGDFWVLDTAKDIWQWSELTSFGDLPSPRDFVAASAIGNRKIVMYGGWDGKRWLSDVYILDTISLEWMELPVSGALPPPRCGHTATMIEKRLLVYGGRGEIVN